MNNTDRELLELAGKAAGMNVIMEGQKWPDGPVGWFFCQVGDGRPALYDRANGAMTRWAPLDDDGDALRLAVRLRLCIDFYGGLAEVCWFETEARKTHSVDEPINDAQDERTASRRAIVRAAAEIGKAMP